jgi:hypothetical protein
MGTRNRVGIGLLYWPARDRICKPFQEPAIDSQPGGPVRQPYLLYRLARLHRLAESVPRNQFLGSLNIYKYGLRLHRRAESIPGLLKRLQIRAQATLASGIGSLESIPRLHNMKNEDEDDFFWIEAKKNEYICTSTNEGKNKNELFVPILSKERR